MENVRFTPYLSYASFSPDILKGPEMIRYVFTLLPSPRHFEGEHGLHEGSISISGATSTAPFLPHGDGDSRG